MKIVFHALFRDILKLINFLWLPFLISGSSACIACQITSYCKKTIQVMDEIGEHNEHSSSPMDMREGQALNDSQDVHSARSRLRLLRYKFYLTKKTLVIVAVVGAVCVCIVGVGVGVGLSGYGSVKELEATNAPNNENKPQSDGRFESWGDDDNGTIATIPPPPSDTILGVYDKGAVSADGVPCAQIAKDIMNKGGNAADATVAGLFCVGVVNTQSMGLGGGFLLTYYSRKNKTAYSLIAREKAPLAAKENMYNGNGSASQKDESRWWHDKPTSLKGGLAVGVPGELRGYHELYKKFGGNLPWKELLEPAIKLCEHGHQVNWHMARALKQSAEDIKAEPSMSVFLNPETGEVWQEGDILKRPKLAETLRILQDNPDDLYSGDLAKKLVEDIKSMGSIITEEDLLKYNAVWRDAVNVTLEHGGLKMYSVPPPGSGLILGFILNILDEYGLTPESLNHENIVLTYHRIIEAFKYAYAKRTELGDADVVDMSELTRNLTSETYAESIHAMIYDNQTFQDPDHYGAVTYNPDDSGTAHFSLLAPNGDAVSVTSTVNLYFGAGIRSVQTGIVLNDQMDDFSAPNVTNYFGIPPSPANFIKPEKRPLSSMCPAIFVDENGDVKLVIGAAGGTKISSGVAWTSMRNLWLGNDIKQAIDARRIHHQLFPMKLKYEAGTVNKIVDGLNKIGHDVEEYGIGGSVVCAVARGLDNKIYANSDFRKSGEVAGA